MAEENDKAERQQGSPRRLQSRRKRRNSSGSRWEEGGACGRQGRQGQGFWQGWGRKDRARDREGQAHRAGPLRKVYETEVRAKLQAELGLKNVMQAPRMQKITVNMGLGEAITNPKIFGRGVEDLAAITGQKPVVTKSSKAIAAFKLKGGQKIGAMVTLRRDRHVRVPRSPHHVRIAACRDFKGVSPKGFDGRGNFTMGVREGNIFQRPASTSWKSPRA